MTIVVTGGGSGGHITPVLAVASELKRLRPGVKVVYIGQRGDGLLDVPSNDPNIDEVYTVSAGKFRRYSGEGWKQILDLPEQVKNVRDAFRVIRGIWQSYWLLRRLKPQIIFTRGGFVSVPVALGAKLNGVPYITHDSDSIPSLANRIIARWARWHAVALPEELYPYPKAKVVMTGIPIGQGYKPVTEKMLATYRQQIGFGQCKQVLLVTGGGNGADQLNRVVVENARYLLKRYPELAIVHFAGRALEDAARKAYEAELSAEAFARVKVLGFVTDFYRYSGAADVIIARGGATNLAEFAVQRKACIIIPPNQLRWAVKNAEAMAARQAVVYFTEAQSEQERRLATSVSELLDDTKRRQQLGVTLSQFARPDAAKQLAMLLLEGKPATKS